MLTGVYNIKKDSKHFQFKENFHKLRYLKEWNGIQKKKTDQRQTKTPPVILHTVSMELDINMYIFSSQPSEWQPTAMHSCQYTRDEHNLAQNFDQEAN